MGRSECGISIAGSDRTVIRPDDRQVRGEVGACAISASGRYVAAASRALASAEPAGWHLQAWRADDGEQLVDVIHDESVGVVRVAFADDALIACLGSGEVDVYDVERKTSRRLSGGDGIVGGIDVDPAGAVLATIGDKGCTLRRLSDGDEVAKVAIVPVASFRGPTCSFSRDGSRIAVAGHGRRGDRRRRPGAIDLHQHRDRAAV